MTEEGASESDAESNDESEDEGTEKGALDTRGPGARIVAVDWALSKSKWEEVKAKALEGQEEDDESDADTEPESASEGGSDEASEASDDSEEVAEDDEERSDAEEAGKPVLPQTDVGTTLFVRNVPFDASEDELRILYVPMKLLIYLS